MATSYSRHSANPLTEWWRTRAIANVDHVDVVERVRDEAGWSGRYAFMTLMSAGIAVLGLLLSSPAVVIGAMLISPLMGPIIGLGFGLATFDTREIRTSATALALGVVLAVAFTAAIVLLSPLQNVTEEIAARTRPTLYDLLIALFSALAGAYAMVRGRAGTIVGVAIATALMPPLAVVGFGLATANWTVFGGSLLLFFTNLMTIALAAAIVARLYGFGAHLSPQHTLVQTVVLLIVFAALAVPLGLTLRQIAWEAAASRQVREVVASQFPEDARVSQIEVNYAGETVRVTATMLTPELRGQAEPAAAATLTRLFDRPVAVALEQVQVAGGEAEAAQLAAASATAQNREATIAAMTDRLALVAGVERGAVLIDRDARRAMVRAVVLPGASLATYRGLEQRIAGTAEGWRVELVPPALPLPEIPYIEDEPNVAALALAAWAGQRIAAPIGVSGPAERAEAVAAALTAAGAQSRVTDGAGNGDAVTLTWLAPDSE
ncbi:DUF389 domain-containing protein [Sphingomonas sp. CJ99]